MRSSLPFLPHNSLPLLQALASQLTLVFFAHDLSIFTTVPKHSSIMTSALLSTISSSVSAPVFSLATLGMTPGASDSVQSLSALDALNQSASSIYTSVSIGSFSTPSLHSSAASSVSDADSVSSALACSSASAICSPSISTEVDSNLSLPCTFTNSSFGPCGAFDEEDISGESENEEKLLEVELEWLAAGKLPSTSGFSRCGPAGAFGDLEYDDADEVVEPALQVPQPAPCVSLDAHYGPKYGPEGHYFKIVRSIPDVAPVHQPEYCDLICVDDEMPDWRLSTPLVQLPLTVLVDSSAILKMPTIAPSFSSISRLPRAQGSYHSGPASVDCQDLSLQECASLTSLKYAPFKSRAPALNDIAEDTDGESIASSLKHCYDAHGEEDLVADSTLVSSSLGSPSSISSPDNKASKTSGYKKRKFFRREFFLRDAQPGENGGADGLIEDFVGIECELDEVVFSLPPSRNRGSLAFEYGTDLEGGVRGEVKQALWRRALRGVSGGLMGKTHRERTVEEAMAPLVMRSPRSVMGRAAKRGGGLLQRFKRPIVDDELNA
ncbi:hypothetical protein DL93DRAFT_2155499 [Clavulina sp. PMI_390]|nr:hypothetical protein DL93DRAFT_2155499 [Clavulina sp. PMI_390]